MKLTRCDRGHYYDVEKFGRCPQCGEADDIPTRPEVKQGQGCTPTVRETPPVSDDTLTVRKWVKNGVQPVVGWLVCIEGDDYGKDFRLHASHNFIGRNDDMDVKLKDASVSGKKHTTITYDIKSGNFYISAGESKELAYLNDKVVLESKEINAYDIISVGNSKLLFVPFCSDNFNWDENK